MSDGAAMRVNWVRLFISGALSCAFLSSCSFETSERSGVGTKFHDYSELNAILANWSTHYPDLVELRTVRDPEDADPTRNLFALVLSDRTTVEESEPRVQLVGAMHGNEELSTELLLMLADYLLSGYYSGNPSARELLDNTELHILPVANPTGFESGTRLNAASVDLNRNFPWSWTDLEASGLSAADQWETRALMHDALEQAYTLSVSLHTGAFGISRLWDYTGQLDWSWNGTIIEYTADYFSDKLLPIGNTVETLAEGYTNLLPEAYFGSFFNREGYDWYPAYGTFQDWSYGEAGIPAFTIEIDVRQEFRALDVDPGAITDSWSIHKASLLYLLDSVLSTTGGRLRDGQTGLPVQGKVTFTRVQDSVSKTIAPLEPQVMDLAAHSDLKAGSFHVYLPPGTYSVMASRLGYSDSEPFMVTIPPNGASALGVINLYQIP